MSKPMTTQNDFIDDAIHLPDPAYRGRTLCDQDAASLNVQKPWMPVPDGGSGCWTCLLRHEQRRAT